MSGYGSKGGSYGRSNDFGPKCEIYVPAVDCGKIIGRGGSKIRDLQDETGCKINVSRDDEGDGTRRVDLSGSAESIQMARECIAKILEGGDDRGGRRQNYGGGGGGGGGYGSNDVREIMNIDSSCVGRIIGKGGSRIRDLQDETSCRINVSREVGSCGKTEVEITGGRQAVDHAMDAINEIVNQAY